MPVMPAICIVQSGFQLSPSPGKGIQPLLGLALPLAFPVTVRFMSSSLAERVTMKPLGTCGAAQGAANGWMVLPRWQLPIGTCLCLDWLPVRVSQLINLHFSQRKVTAGERLNLLIEACRPHPSSRPDLKINFKSRSHETRHECRTPSAEC